MNPEINQLKQQVFLLEKQLRYHEHSMQELKQRSDIQNTLNEVLYISLMSISIEEQMEKILHIILDIEWLALEKKGCVFLTDDSGRALEMVAQYNLSDSLLTQCRHIKFGECLCGIAAQKKKVVFRNCVDRDHHIRPEGMKPHGHYNVPILFEGVVVGVLNLYVKHGHQSSQLELDFLHSCVASMASIIKRKQLEVQLHKLSYHDELTGLLNRRMFMNILDDRINEAEKSNLQFAILFIDLDRFKSVNDTYGHDYGDRLLVLVSKRMHECLHESDKIARLGGDEFIILLEEGADSDEHVLKVAKKLIHVLSQPYEIHGEIVSIGASIGISLYPHHDTHSEGLLKKADNALYQAKNTRGYATISSELILND